MAKQGIANFKSHILTKGIQVASHFEFSMVFPIKDDSGAVRVVAGPVSVLRCESVSLPDLSINTMENHRFGFGTQDIVPYALSYFETVATFIGDQNGQVYKLFYEWFKLIMQMPDNPTAGSGTLRSTNEDRGNNLEDYEVGFKADIVVPQATITAFDHVGDPIYTVTLFDVFPRSITTTTLNWAAGDELVRYTTFLSFKDFKIDFHKISGPPAIAI